MNDLRKLFIDTCEDYKNIVDTFAQLSDIIGGEVWDFQMGEEIENLFLTTIKFIYKSRYPEDTNAVGSLYSDFVRSLFILIFCDVVTINVDGEDKIIKTFEDLWELWFNTTGISIIQVI